MNKDKNKSERNKRNSERVNLLDKSSDKKEKKILISKNNQKKASKFEKIKQEKNLIKDLIISKKINLKNYIKLRKTNTNFKKVDKVQNISFNQQNIKKIIFRDMNLTKDLPLKEKDLQTYKEKINYKFKKNPNLKYKITITKTNNPCGYTHLFELYICHKDNKIYIASKNFNYNIDIYELLFNKKILSLKGHKYDIENVRYFINKKNFNEYLISADSFVFAPKVIVWDINDNYKIKHIINTQYNSGIIFSCLLIFPYNYNDNFIISSTSNENIYYKKYASTKIYSLNNGKFFKYIKDSETYNVYYLLSWYNKINNKNYVIQFCGDNVIINDLFSDEIYSDISVNDNEHRFGLILEKDNTEYLYYTSNFGNIVIYDLYKKSIIKNVKFNRYYTLNFIQWNENYFIFSDCYNYSFFILDSQNFKIISQVKTDDEKCPVCINKIYHPKYGESLLVLIKNGEIQLWSV